MRAQDYLWFPVRTKTGFETKVSATINNIIEKQDESLLDFIQARPFREEALCYKGGKTRLLSDVVMPGYAVLRVAPDDTYIDMAHEILNMNIPNMARNILPGTRRVYCLNPSEVQQILNLINIRREQIKIKTFDDAIIGETITFDLLEHSGLRGVVKKKEKINEFDPIDFTPSLWVVTIWVEVYSSIGSIQLKLKESMPRAEIRDNWAG